MRAGGHPNLGSAEANLGSAKPQFGADAPVAREHAATWGVPNHQLGPIGPEGRKAHAHQRPPFILESIQNICMFHLHPRRSFGRASLGVFVRKSALSTAPHCGSQSPLHRREVHTYMVLNALGSLDGCTRLTWGMPSHQLGRRDEWQTPTRSRLSSSNLWKTFVCFVCVQGAASGVHQWAKELKERAEHNRHTVAVKVRCTEGRCPHPCFYMH